MVRQGDTERRWSELGRRLRSVSPETYDQVVAAVEEIVAVREYLRRGRRVLNRARRGRWWLS